jgi:signal peptidase II
MPQRSPMLAAARLTPGSAVSDDASAQQAALRFLLWAASVLTLDLATKQWAITTLSDRAVPLVDWFSLFLVYNTGAAGGVSWGPYTWLISTIGSMATVAMVLAVLLPLARVDTRAAAAMGLVAGGALGNLSSMLGEPRGVPDFLALRLPDAFVIFNVADLGLWAGAMLLLPIARGLVRIIRAERRDGAPAPRQNPM